MRLSVSAGAQGAHLWLLVAAESNSLQPYILGLGHQVLSVVSSVPAAGAWCLAEGAACTWQALTARTARRAAYRRRGSPRPPPTRRWAARRPAQAARRRVRPTRPRRRVRRRSFGAARGQARRLLPAANSSSSSRRLRAARLPRRCRRPGRKQCAAKQLVNLPCPQPAWLSERLGM